MKRLFAFLAGVLVSLPIAAQTVVLITAVPTPGGVVSSKYRDGNDGSAEIPLTWATIGPFTGIIEGATPCYDLRTYLTEPGSPDATLSLVGSVTNWSLSTDDLCYDGTGVSSGTLIARATRSAVVSDSASFAVSSVAASGADTTAPTIITGVTAALNGSNRPVLTFDASQDVRVSGQDLSGLNTFTVRRNGTPLTPTAFTGTGLAPTFTGADVGDLVPDGTSTQTVAAWNLTAEGLGTGSVDEFRFVSTPITGDFTCTVKVTAATFVSGTRIGLIAREQTGTLRRYVAGRILSTFAVRGHHRSVSESTAPVSAGLVQFTALPIWLQLERSGNDWSVRSSDNGNAWSEVLALNLGLAITVDAGLQLFSGTDSSVAEADFENLACTSRPQQTYTDSAATAGTTPSYTVIATDIAANISTASTAISIAIPADPEPPPNVSDTPDYADPVDGVVVGAQTVTEVADSAALTTALTDQDCGETLNLATGTYTGSRAISASCAATVPFIVKCATALGCTATGTWTVTGDRSIITGIKFNGTAAKVVLSAHNAKIIANEFTAWTNGYAVQPKRDAGDANDTKGEIAYNHFHDPGAYPGGTNGGAAGQRIAIRTSDNNGFHSDAWVHHNLFENFPDKPTPTNYNSGQSDAIEVCETQTPSQSNLLTGWYIEHNLIDDHLQGQGTGAATVDFKCAGNVFRYNTITDTAGRVDSRAGNGTNGTYGNVFESNYITRSGGMQLRGQDQHAVCNFLRGGGTVVTGVSGAGKLSAMAGDRACTNVAAGTQAASCDAVIESNDASQLHIGNVQPSGNNFACDGTDATRCRASGTILRNHTGQVTIDADGQSTTTNTPGAAATYTCSDPVELLPADVGPDAITSASQAYKDARDY